MKRLFVFLAAVIVLLAGCDKKTAPASAPSPGNNGGTQAVNIANEDAAPTSSSADVEIKEKMFVAQVNDIYLNADDYLGKTIKYEGIFDVYVWEEENQSYYSVIRYGPGCCGNDGNVGFEVSWDGAYPDKNDWVEVVGKLEFYEENGGRYLRIAIDSLTVLETRGTEYVSW